MTEFKTNSVIEKWYKKLSFDKKYDSEFYRCLNSIEIPEDTSIENYPLTCDDGKRNLLAFLYMCEALEQKYKKKGIPKSILYDTLSDIVIWCDVWSELKEELFLGEIGWLSNHLSGVLFKLGRLQFAIQHFSEDDEKYGIQKGEYNIGVHIPAVGPLTQEECTKSLAAADGFFAKFFPDVSYRYYTCHSWLLDDTLKEILPVTSNILKFGDMFHKISADRSDDILKYVFKWNTTRSNISSVQPTSSFSAKVKERAEAGLDFYIVTGLIKK